MSGVTDLIHIYGTPILPGEKYTGLTGFADRDIGLAGGSGRSAAEVSLGDVTLDIPQPLEIATGVTPLDTIAIRPDFPAAVWSKQTKAIDEQNAHLQRVMDMLEDRRDEIPNKQESDNIIDDLLGTLFGETAEELLFFGVRWLLTKLFGMGAAAAGLLGFLTVIGVLLIKQLWDSYTRGIDTADSFIKENDAIRDLDPGDNNEKAWEWFYLREHVLTRHAAEIHNILTEIIALEQQTESTLGHPGSADDDLISAINDLRYNNIIVEGTDGRRLILNNGIVQEDD